MDHDKELAAVVLRQGELKLTAQMQLALAADNRATVLAGIFSTLAVTGVSGAAVLWKLGPGYGGWLAGLIVQVVLLIGAAYLCVHAARPTDFYTVGNRPMRWWKDGVERKSLAACLKQESDNYQHRIDRNSELITGNANLVSNALHLAVLSPLPVLVAVLARIYIFR
jgi:hypothetical protein